MRNRIILKTWMGQGIMLLSLRGTVTLLVPPTKPASGFGHPVTIHMAGWILAWVLSSRTLRGG